MVEEYDSGYQLDYKQIAASAEFSSATRLLAHRLIEQPYMAPGEYFRQLNKHDIDCYRGMLDFDDEDDPIHQARGAEIMIIVLMLARAEGVEMELEDVRSAMGAFIVIITGISLAMKGLVEVTYENISFGPDADKLVVLRKIPGADYSQLKDSDE